MLLIISGVVWVFSIFSESQKLSNSTEQRIQGIQIAREWIEAFENIRDTNWLLFAADYGNCWNVMYYNAGCIWTTNTVNDIGHQVSYIVEKSANNRWFLTPITKTTANDEFSDADYRNDFLVQQDADGFYVQWGWGTDIIPIFTREIYVEYIEDTNSDLFINSNDEKVRITSIVQWNDSAWDTARRVELVTELTNWKNES